MPYRTTRSRSHQTHSAKALCSQASPKKAEKLALYSYSTERLHPQETHLHVTLFPVQLWKYSCPITPSIRLNMASVVCCGAANTNVELKMLSDLFSMAPMLKSPTATMLNKSRSYSLPNRSSSHFIARFKLAIAQSTLPMF